MILRFYFALRHSPDASKSLKLGAAEQETEQLPSPFLIPSFLYSFLRHAAAMRTLPSVLCLAAFLATIPLVPAAVGDSLAVGQSIRDNETLISPEGTFCLGFFTGRPNRRYLGMWYNRVTIRTVVWVANRQRPLLDSTGSLVLFRNGSLVLGDAAGTVYWSANPSGTLGNPVARLLDEGNLVVRDEGDSSYAWQSFAEPTDTLLPGMNIGVNRRTGVSYNITAWKTLDDPKLGDYSWVLIDSGVPQLFVMNGSVPLWRAGPWVGDRFTGVPEMKGNGLFSYGFTSNSDELYFKFDVWNKSMLTQIHVDPSGSAKHLRWVDGSRTWEPLWESANDTCDRLGVCGANALCNAAMSGSVCGCMDGFQTPQQQTAGQRGARGAAAVCERTRTLACPGGEDTFVLVAGAKLPDTSLATGTTMGFDDCRAACLRNCSCTAFTSADGSGCITWFGNLTDLRYYRHQGQDLYVRVASDANLSSTSCVVMHAAMGKATPAVLFCVLYLSISSLPAAAANTLRVGESMKDNDTLTSAEGTFVLGFFTGRANNRYLGIWYNRIPGPTVVWVANRRHPVPGSTGSLNLTRNGSLVLADAAGTVYWSTKPPSTAWSGPLARILDNGNLVVLNESGGGYAWESFAQPSDSVLPGMNIGFNRRTGERLDITSWRSADDPAPGNYSTGLDMRGVPQLFLFNGPTPVWRGGPWVGERMAGIPEMMNNGEFKYGFLPNSDVVYFTYDVWDRSLLARIVVNQSGFLEHLVWDVANNSWEISWSSGNQTCDKIGACGPYGLCVDNRSTVCRCPEGFQPRQNASVTAGCERKVPMDCSNGNAFVVVQGVKLPDTAAATVDRGLDFNDCRARCLRNCSCTAFSISVGSGCIAWFGELVDLRTYDSGGQDLYVRVAGQGGKNGKTVIITIVVLGVFVVMMFPLLFYSCRRRRQMRRKRLEGSQQSMDVWHSEGSENSDFDLALFHFNILEIATNYFSFQNKLGEGGYGPVYKGKLHDGECVAIKRLSKDSTQGLEQFKSEVKLVARLQHTNLVRLLGCCIENEEKILVYEYMQNQSLDRFIFDANRGRQLDWAKRLHIIEGITQGLLYLHKYSRLRVIHRDLKASNILLDDEWNPKISDFGLARIFSWNEPQANTKRIIGTYGYMPPEYAMRGLFSVKSDVFSFGILLLEILSGKKNTSIHDFGISRNLPGRAWELWREGRELELVDPAMGNSVSKPEFSRCFHVALLCVQENPVDRPTMLDIVSMLNSEATSLPPPNQPAFFLVRPTSEEGDIIEVEHASSSNSVTFTSIQGR